MKSGVRFETKVGSWDLTYKVVETENGKGSGIEVSLATNGKLIDRQTVQRIPAHRREIEAFCRRLAKQGVFPESLRDVVQDWLRERSFKI